VALVPSQVILSTDEMGRIAPPIFTSVGRNGVNTPGDVFVVQSLLNDRLPRPHTAIPVTGEADVGTVIAIETYQAVVMNMIPPTGRVDPGSPTYYSLAARPLVDEVKPAAVGRVGQVPPDIIDAALASYHRWAVPASITIAQWIVESAWGAAMPPGSNNPFGIKARADEPSVESPTREVINGESITVVAKFRRFESVVEAFDQHGKLLATGTAYKPAMQVKDNPEAFADALTGKYATDPEYGFTLKWVMKNYGLFNYDVK
jgi:Mannosyl-glycoprotein endo-beta-N-acetylglucosaminidase